MFIYDIVIIYGRHCICYFKRN